MASKPTNQPARGAKPQPARRTPQSGRPPSAASAILSGGKSKRPVAGLEESYGSPGWLILFGTFLTIALISFLFTPFTHQLDEIKNVLLMLFPPFLLLAAVYFTDFSSFTWKTHAPSILLGLYFLWMALSYLVNPYKMVGERTVWFSLGCATFTCVFAWFLNSETKFRKTMVFFVSLALASTVFGLMLFAGRYTEQFYQGMLENPYWNTEARRPWMTLAYTLLSSQSDMYSFILNPDFYAAFLVMLLPLPISMFFVETRVRLKVLAVTTFLLMFICLILTNSNDSFIALFFMAILFAWLTRRYVREWNLSRQFLWAFVICMIVLVVAIAWLVWPTMARTLDFKASAFEGRRVLWGGGFWAWVYGDDRFRNVIDPISVIFGTGPGGYRHYFPWFRRNDFFDQQINNVTTFGHNWYLDVLLETGLVGLVLFVAFHVRIVTDALRQVKHTQSRTHLFYQIALLTGMAGIAIQNYSSPNNRWAVAGMTYWCLFGLSMGLNSLDNPAIPGINKDRRWFGAPVALVARIGCFVLAGLFFARSVFPGAQFANYWSAAKANARGLQFMDQIGQLPAEYRDRALGETRLAFEKAVRDNPTFVTSYYKLGHVYNQLDLSDKAIETYETLDKINPSYSELPLNLGVMYAAEAEMLPRRAAQLQAQARQKLTESQSAPAAQKETLREEAAQLMEEATSLEKNLQARRLDNQSKAYQHLQEAARQSRKPNVQYLAGSVGDQLADMYVEAGETEKAAALREEIKGYYRSIIGYQPKLEDVQMEQKDKYPRAQQQLVRLALETEKPEEALSVLKTMVQENPDNNSYVDMLLATYDKLNQKQPKVDFLKEAVKADPTDDQLRYRLAEALQEVGKPEEALLELRKVEVLSPENIPALQKLQQAYSSAGDNAKSQEYVAKLAKLGAEPQPQTTDTLTAADAVTTAAAVQQLETSATVGETSAPGQTPPGTTTPSDQTLATTSTR